MQPRYRLHSDEHSVEVRQLTSGNAILNINDDIVTVQLQQHDNHHLSIKLNGTPHSAVVTHDEHRIYIHLDGKTWELERLHDRLDAAGSENAADGAALAPMPGVILEVNAKDNEPVSAGDCLCLMESMKMQIEILADVDGVVSSIPISAGDNVQKNALLVQITPSEPDAGESL